MKLKSLLFIASAATAFAGTPVMTPAPAPAPAPCLAEWFVGGTFGQLDNVGTNVSTADAFSLAGGLVPSTPGAVLSSASVSKVDFNAYTLQVGRSLTNTNGWDLAAYLEVGWLDGSMDLNASGTEGLIAVIPWSARERIDIDIIPVTLDFKVEHQIYGPIDGYVTAGAGYAWSKISALGQDTRDGGFYGQASAGLIYNICERFELLGGARWSYLSHVNIGDTPLELNNNKIGWEIGARYKF